MRENMKKRLMSALLSVVLLFGLLPTGVMAAETNAFILVAEAGGSLVITPEYVYYTEGMTVRDALAASGHTFTGLEDDWIMEIDGAVGNYSRSDEDGSFDLNLPASEVSFYRFCESEDSRPSEGLQQLMTAMADYSKKDADVRKAAKEAYDTARNQFVGISSESAAVLAENLNTAVSEYENAQSGALHRITFSDGSSAYSDVSIIVENTFGKTWTDDGDGVLELPAGSYTFCVSQNGLMVEGEISVSGDMTVTAAFPEQPWLKLDAFRLSGSYGALDSEENRFSDDEYELGSWDERKLTVPVTDTFTGKVYTYAEYDTGLLSEAPALTAIYRTANTNEAIKQDIPFESFMSGAANVLKRGSGGNTVIYRVSSTGSDGYTYSQDYTVTFARVPSLTGISVKDQNGVDQTAATAFDGDVTDYTYKVLDTVTAVTINAVPLEAEYEVTVNGQDAAEGVTVELSEGEETDISIAVRAGDYLNTYTLKILPGEGRALSFVTDRADVTLEVVNSNGEVMPFERFREGISGNRYQYTLVPGETYSYVATSATWYHIADEFTMEDVADSTIRVDVPTEDWLSGLAFGTKTGSGYKNSLPLDTTFVDSDHNYQVSYVDTEYLAYVWVTADTGVNVQAIYDQKFASDLYHGKERIQELTSGAATGTLLKRFLMDENPLENILTIRLSKEIDGVLYYQDYQVDFLRSLTMKDMSAACGGLTVSLVWEDQSVGFNPDVKEYSVTVSMAADTLDLAFSLYKDNTCYGEEEVGYRVKVDGEDVTEAGTAEIILDGTMDTQNVTITVENDKAPKGTAEYILHILKSPPIEAAFDIKPEQALLTVYETMSGERLWADEGGRFQFCEGYNYQYNLTSYGYVSKSGTLSVTRDEAKALVVMDGNDIYPVTETAEGGGALTINWTLEPAEINDEIRTDMTAEWPNFRGDASGNAVTEAPTPNAAEKGTLYWANQIGEGYSSNAVGSPILVDGDLITYAGAKIYRVDTVSGEVKATGTMDHKSAHATTPPSYAEGMVFVAQTDGTVQAFNADTLKSLWIYKDPLGGQPVCPLTIKGGYLYTGFWNSEKGDANFVCMSITDEDPHRTDESKCVSWYYTTQGGYYWAGAYVADDYVLMGTDDGTSTCTGQSSRMLLFDPVNGALMDSWDGLNGDVRSTVVYDSVTDAYYFTSKGGSFYSVRVEQGEDGWKLTDQWSVALTNGTDGVPMSTCSPVVYNGRAYVGVSGEGQFSPYSGHNVTVIDLNKKAIAYRVQTQGYPQTSGLLTTAYEEENGYVYIYFFDNMTPGKLRVLRDKAGQTDADYVTMEGSNETAYALFTPTGDQAQYAICSPIVDEYGTIYFKNDSAYLMAFGSVIEKIEVTTQPKKMVYAEGGTFDPTGMIVTATYANGKTRDITPYVTYDEEPITADHTTITISFPYVMYHNEEDGTSMSAGIVTTTPVTTLTLTIGEEGTEGDSVLGDVNGDGEIDTVDATMIIASCYGKVDLTAEQMMVSDVNGDGEIDTVDATMIIAFCYGKIETLS